MAEAVDDEQRGLALGHGGGQRPALARRDDRIVAAMHQDELERQLRQVAPRQVESFEIGPDARRQSVDQRWHPVRIGVVQQRHHGATFRTEAGPQVSDVGRRIGELARRDRGQRLAVGGVGQTRRRWPARTPTCRRRWAPDAATAPPALP